MKVSDLFRELEVSKHQIGTIKFEDFKQQEIIMKKRLVLLSCSFILLSSIKLQMSTIEMIEIGNKVTMQREINLTSRAEVIEVIYREYDGKIQYRRWNKTRNYWVDPYWIDL